MDDNDPQPMTDADVVPPPAGAEFVPAAPLKDTGASFASESHGRSVATKDDVVAAADDEAAAAKPVAEKLGRQASDKALAFVGQGKDRATHALDQLSQLLTDAAKQVDEKLGGQYGQYARTAAGNVQQFAEQLRTREPDDLVDDARTFVRKSPGVAIGAAAAVGFVLARLVSAGIDQRPA